MIPNAVDLAQFTFNAAPDASLRRELALGEGPVLGFIGSFYAYEGLDLLVDALPLLRDAVPGVRLLLVGGGKEADALRARTAALRLDDSVLFTGRVPHAEVARYYGLVDLFVYPRKSMRLTELVTPLKPLEAMAQGKLVLASDVGGHRELIDDGRTGYLFRSGSSDSLAVRACEALAERDRWSEIRDEARRFVERERTWPVSVANYAAVYQQLAQAR